MTCRTIEQLILESEDRSLDAGERRRVDGHLRDCADCRAFAAGRATVREALKGVRWPTTPQPVEAKTRRLCLEEMAAAERGRADGRARMPVPVAVAAILFTVLAVVWTAGALADLRPGESLPASAWLAVAFIAQNVITLFLAPVVLGAGRSARDEETRSAQRI
jgi:predicted anti-sigma-YlaC factor YlaD